ncbi:MAG: DEAD/DEAH box helicase [Methanomassiliicoccales archaeon]
METATESGISGKSILRLDSRLSSVLLERNITELHQLQKDVFNQIYSGRHVLLCAPTGVGKTEAAMLPILQRMIDKGEERGINCLYITPLRSLNRDMLQRLKQLASAAGFDVAVRHGDTVQSERNRQSAKPPNIMITTPETVQILLLGKRLRDALKNLHFVVVDELHEMLSSERGAQLSVALERLERIAPGFQRVGLSATIGSPEVAASLLSGSRETMVARIPVEKERQIEVSSPESTEEAKALAAEMETDEGFAATLMLGRSLIEANRSTLFFVNTRDLAEAIASRYHHWLPDLPIGVHHGSLSRELRMQMEEEFKEGKIKCLICTSSLELGIDIGSVDLSIQFNSPRQVTRLLQRTGRSGHRMGRVSRGKIIGYDEDELLEAAVISKRGLKDELEEQRVRSAPLTVLANQITAMASEGGYSRGEMFDVFRRTLPFKEIDRQLFDSVFEFLLSSHMIRDEGKVRRTMKGLRYFYENISMIRDERTYNVRDISTRRIIGTLDEGFIFSFAEEGAIFITHGRSWKIVELRESEILVEPVGVLGALPSWIGEEIPVPFEVAQEVGRIRETRNLSDYPLDERAKTLIETYLSKVEGAERIPTDRRIVIESSGSTVVVNACFGTRVNETLSRLIAAVISARTGEGVGTETDPYRILIRLPARARKEWVEEALKSIEPEALAAFMSKVVLNLNYAKYQFLYTAKKFGIIRKDADYREVNMQRLMSSYENTPLMEETVEKTIWESMDIELTAQVLRKIREGEIRITYAPISVIGAKGIQKTMEMYRPARADRAILDALRKRLMKEEFTLLCLNCNATSRVTPMSAERRISCFKCGGRMLAALGGYEKEQLKGKKWKGNPKLVSKLRKNAELVREYGRNALLVLAGRGVGPDAAARILASGGSEEQLLRAVLEQEINFARTKRFWD